MAVMSLKAQNVAPLALLLLLQLLAIHSLNSATFDLSLLVSIQQAGGVMLAIGALAGWLSYLLPVDLKNAIVFLRVRNVLPGHRFIQLAEADPRIDCELLRVQVPDYLALSSDHKAQNSVWYREFYRPVINQPAVASTHRSYLLYRDGTSISLLSAAMFVFAKFLLESPMSAFGYASVWIFLISALGFMLAARNAGTRLVTTVLAIRLAETS